MTGGTHWRSGDYRVTEKSRDYFEMSGGEQPASAGCHHRFRQDLPQELSITIGMLTTDVQTANPRLMRIICYECEALLL
jgi:hypothetical protein